MRLSIPLPSSAPTLFLALGLVGCGDPPGPLTQSIWIASDPSADLPLTRLSSETFFDHPWPSDLRLANDKVSLKNFPNPRMSGNIQSYTEVMDGRLDGFSPAAAGYVRFSGPLDSNRFLPTPYTVRSDSPVQLIDIDPDSPEFGERKLVVLQFRELPGVYYQPNTLAFMPAPGFPLRGHTQYAFVVTDGIFDVNGRMIGKSPDLTEVLGEAPTTRPATEAARTALAPAVQNLEKLGVSRRNIVHLAVFRTSNPTQELFEFRDHLRDKVDAPTAYPNDWFIVSTTDVSAEYVGKYGPSPNYQDGTLPFASPKDGGDFLYDEDGAPKVHSFFDLRFSLTIPTLNDCPMPPNGYPIALYAHGTNGDYRSYVEDGTATSLARRCIASMGVDQIFHGEREGSAVDDNPNSTAIRFFNVNNVLAARTNNRQSALDEVQRARLFTETKIEIPAKISVWGHAIRFDPKRVMFFGHSQGGLNGPLFLAADDQALGGVLSGSGAIMSITLTEKTKPDPSVANLVKDVMLGLDGEEYEEADLFHPAMSLAQMLVDVTDPLHYARQIIKEPRNGWKPKSVYMTEGIRPDGTGDNYSPTRGIELHAVAMGLPLIDDTKQFGIPETTWPGGPQLLSLKGVDVSNNLADGKATGALAQFAPPGTTDGHFVIFRVAAARTQSSEFIRTLGTGPSAVIKAPSPPQ